ncbi:MAG: hypothetical protein WC670_09620 [Pseudolabrys sp.]|jgi:hypothetical protein
MTIGISIVSPLGKKPIWLRLFADERFSQLVGELDTINVDGGKTRNISIIRVFELATLIHLRIQWAPRFHVGRRVSAVRGQRGVFKVSNRKSGADDLRRLLSAAEASDRLKMWRVWGQMSPEQRETLFQHAGGHVLTSPAFCTEGCRRALAAVKAEKPVMKIHDATADAIVMAFAEVSGSTPAVANDRDTGRPCGRLFDFALFVSQLYGGKIVTGRSQKRLVKSVRYMHLMQKTA